MKLIIYFFLIVNVAIGQNTQNPNELLNMVYSNLVNDNNGSLLEFDYYYENDSHKMHIPIKGSLAIFSNNRFYLNFNKGENEMIQIYNGEYISTIFIKEKEIQIDYMDGVQDFLIHNIFTNYSSKFETNTISKSDTIAELILTPKLEYSQVIYNNCIDEVGLPTCLKLPSQCKIGIQPILKEKLIECLDENNGYKENNILNINIKINFKALELISISQENRHNGKTNINIKKTEKVSEKILNIDTLYKEFEVIDLR
tara:strand:- start:804 stop:1571 length:768 start_codon:yes stop_codon:yes gene_type:complete